MFCPNCGSQLSDGVKFCRKCGCRIQDQPQQQNQQPQQQQYQQPRQQYQQAQYQPQYQQAAGRAAGKAAKRVAKKAGGGLLKKLITAVLVVTVGGAAISVGSEIFSGGGGGGEPGNGGTGNISVSTNGTGGSTTAESASFSISKSTYAPGETITVTYSGIPDKMISNGAWFGMAGHLNGPMEHLNKEPVTKSSGKITMKAPSAVGQYQVRFFKAQDATADNLAASLDFTVVSRTSENTDVYELCDGMNFAVFDLLTETPTGSITTSGSNVTIDLRPFEYSDSDREADFGGVKLKGTITGTKNMETSGGACKCYEIKIDGGFSYSMHDQYIGAFDGYVTFNNVSGMTYGDSCRAQIYEFADGHKECKITLYGELAISVQYPGESEPQRRTENGTHTFILAQNGERRYI